MFQCNDKTTVDDFATSILVDDDDGADDTAFTRLPRFSWDRDVHLKEDYGSRIHHQQAHRDRSEHQKIADVVVAKNLNLAHQHVQIQALELIRGKRIFTRTAVHTAPKRFLFIALLPIDDETRLIPQLNDHMFLSHNHLLGDEEDGEQPAPSLSELSAASESSVIHSPPMSPGLSHSHRSSVHQDFSTPNTAIITPADISTLKTATSAVRLDSEIRSYIHNIAIFLRMHRCVAGGVSALATQYFLRLSHVLSPLHGLGYVSPGLVALAARKVYAHRIVLATEETEKSLMWGSEAAAVREMLEGVTEEDVIEDVLGSVETPL